MLKTIGPNITSQELNDNYAFLKQKMDQLTFNVKDYGAKGDGIADDTAPIQAAIDAAYAAGGGAVFFPTTSAHYLSGRVYLKSNLWLLSNGATLKAKAGTNYIVSLNVGDNMRVVGFIFDGTNLTHVGGDSGADCAAIYMPVSGTYHNIEIASNRFNSIPMTNQSYHAIVANGADIFVHDNYVMQSGGDALNFNGGYAVVHQNTVLKSGDGGIAFNNNARGIISDNRLEYCELGIGAGPEGYTSDTDTQNRFIITGNLISACRYGINLGWYAVPNRTAPTNVEITGNVIKNCKLYGIRYDAHAAYFEGNINIAGNTFSGTGSNDYDGTAGADPIDISLLSVSVVSITGNTCHRSTGTGTRVGIFVYSGYSVIVANNVVHGKDGVTPYSVGIQMPGVRAGVIEGNTLNVVTTGIDVQDGNLTAQKLNIIGNTVDNYGTQGILIEGSTTLFNISQNIINGSGNLLAIDLSAAMNTAQITGNVITGTTRAIVVNAGAADNYNISFNTVFTATITDSGTGTRKQLMNNW